MSEQSSLLSAKPVRQAAKLERRASVRYQCSREASCSSLAPFERLSGKVRNISLHGIALVLDTAVQQGTELVLELKTKNPGICLTLLARAVHAMLEAEGNWVVGCEFVTSPTEEQIQALL